MELLEKTTVESKKPGDTISAKDINSMNETINRSVAYINTLLKKVCDINLEFGSSKRQFSLGTAVSIVPVNRRAFGMKIKFLNFEGTYSEYYYVGTSLDETSWNSEKNWAQSNINLTKIEEEEDQVVTVIDGGEW